MNCLSTSARKALTIKRLFSQKTILENPSSSQHYLTTCRFYQTSNPIDRPEDPLRKSDYPSARAHHEPNSEKNPTRTQPFTVSESEIQHFNKLGSTWWNEFGGFGLLHKMNPVRVRFMKDRLLDDELIPHSPKRPDDIDARRIAKNDPTCFEFLDQKQVLDVGCGGGIFSEVLARLGARVLGIDAAEDSIKAAVKHAQLDPHFYPAQLSSCSQLDTPLAYRHVSVEDLLESDNHIHRGRYDVVCAMEVIEHVENPSRFLTALADLTKPGGHIILSTISRTPLARLLTITLAESNLPMIGLVPPGTHTYDKYVKPEELAGFFRTQLGWAKSFERVDLEIRGCMYNPLAAKWDLFPRDALWGGWCNYFFGVRKPS